MNAQTQPTWSITFLGLALFALLMLVALVTVATVLISSRHSFEAWRRFKATLAVLVWVVPAAAILTWFGTIDQPRWGGVPLTPAPTGHEQLLRAPPQNLRPAPVVGGFNARKRRIERSVAAHDKSIEIATAENLPTNSEDPTDRMAALPADSARGVAPGDPADLESVNLTSEPTPSPPRLKVRQISSDPPQWTTASNIVNGRELITLSSARYATLAAAEENVTQMALSRVRDYFYSEAAQGLSAAEFERLKQRWVRASDLPIRLPDGIEAWKLPDLAPLIDLVDRHAVRDLVGEVMDWDFKNGTVGKMYRAHLRLDLGPALRDQAQVAARTQIVEHRLWGLGGLLGLVTLMLGTASGYFKLDDATGGAYRRRLKLAAVALIAAGCLATFRVLGT